MGKQLKPEDFASEAEALCKLGRLFGKRGWCLATSGNFSLRVTGERCLITRSGREKSRLTPDDLMVCTLDGVAEVDSSKPSAETPVHACIYRLDAGVGAVLHTHSVNATVLSRAAGSTLAISGYEMQKAIAGISSHEETIELVVFDNDQDMHALAGRVESAWADGRFAVPGFLIRGHGLYAWGNNLQDARRHVEGFEFLFQCAWQELLAKSS